MLDPRCASSFSLPSKTAVDAVPRDAARKLFAAPQTGAMTVTGKPPATENMRCVYQIGVAKSRYMPVLITASSPIGSSTSRQLHPPLKTIDFLENKELNKIVGDSSKSGRLKQPDVRRSEGTAYSNNFQGHTGRRLEEAARPLVGPEAQGAFSSSLAGLVAPGVTSFPMTTSLDHFGAPYRVLEAANQGSSQMWRPQTQLMTQGSAEAAAPVADPTPSRTARALAGRRGRPGAGAARPCRGWSWGTTCKVRAPCRACAGPGMATSRRGRSALSLARDAAWQFFVTCCLAL
ncbi:unnamed protein product [Prorocentrum cordatum]|uniref:Uncharacterized protein n=1 Tax=Prorocentrum cordatum TaxID=2364126 RepID=A0ABN9UFC2_9DINO|nr:unnamed protein product [Polarella glacialis]